MILVLEWSGRNLNLTKLYKKGYRVLLNKPGHGTHGVCVFARNIEVKDAHLITSPVPGPCRIPFTSLRLKIHGKLLTIIGIHAPLPVSSCKGTTNKTIQSIADWIHDGRLIKPIGKSPAGEYVFVAGDFNASPFNPVLKKLEDIGLKDAFSVRSWRPGPTWSPSSWFPAFLRIDYIWIPKAFNIENAQVIHLPGSDHRDVVVDVIL